MKVESKQASVSSSTYDPGAQSPQSASRERAIAALLGTQPVPNANNVSTEELSAISTPETSQRQNDTTEAPAESSDAPQEETKAAQPNDKLSAQYAILARKEKQLRARIQEQQAQLQAKEAAIQSQIEQAVKAKEQEYKAREQEYQSKYIPKERLSQDTWNVLAEAGMTYDDLTRLALNPPPAENPTQRAAMERIQAKLQAIEEKQAQSDKSFQDQQTQSYQQAVTQIKNETKQLVYTDPNFETIKATNSVNDVVDLIEKTFKADGILLSVEEAAQAVEDYLVDEAVKLSRLKKVQTKLQPKAQAQAQKPQSTQQQQSTGMKTLTNAVTSSRKLSARDRAILAFKGEKQ